MPAKCHAWRAAISAGDTFVYGGGRYCVLLLICLKSSKVNLFSDTLHHKRRNAHTAHVMYIRINEIIVARKDLHPNDIRIRDLLRYVIA